MRILCVFGQHNYGDPARGEGYEYVNFIPALRRLGHEVHFLESWNRTCYRDFAELNERLLRTVEETRPDVVFSVMFTYEIWLETWELLRDAGLCATVNWTTDDSWKYVRSSRFLAPVFHAITTTYPSALAHYEKDGFGNAFLTQWAASADSLRAPLPAAKCKYSVSFIGTAHGERPRWIRELGRRGIDVACFGQGWPAGPLAGPEIPEIIQSSVISLNFANATRTWDGWWPRHTDQLKARIFEIPGAGGFLLTQWAEGLDRHYWPGREVAVFRGLDDLVTQIRYFLAYPTERDAVAAAGHDRTRRDHLYDQRFPDAIAFALEHRETSQARQSPTSPRGIDWRAFEQAVARHRRPTRLQLLGTLLTGACSLVWGGKRGRRAARRILFELSWRLAGKQTYTAAGLPGRLFYGVS